MGSARVALYLRLSREDGDETESQSITNQRTFLTNYAKEHSLPVVEILTDDGYSGTRFDRPGFQKLLSLIELGEIDTVLVKDLSRLGRDYIQTGHYLERYFPEHRVRFIAVNDNIDTAASSGGNDMAPMLSVFNDMYAKDISKKVRSSLKTKKQAGCFIGSSPPYGYQKSKEQPGKLVIDPEAATVVKRIFLSYLQTGSIIGVAKHLTEHGIPTPSQYRSQSEGTAHSVAAMWSDAMIRRILENPTYAGHLTQNRTKKISYKVKKKESIPKAQWITVQNTHEPIVPQEQFDQAQQMLGRRTYIPHKTGAGKHLLSGLAFCADCGGSMTFVRESQTRTYLVCRTSRVSGRLHLCSSHCIREDAVEQAIQDSLRTLSEQMVNREQLEQSLSHPDTRQYQRLLDQLRQKQVLSEKTIAHLYQDKVQGIISETQFLQMNQTFLQEQARLEQEISALRAEQTRRTAEADTHASLKKLLSFETLHRGTLLALVKKVIVYQDKKLDILFHFSKPD